VPSKDNNGVEDPKMYIAHSRVWIKDAKHRGTIAIVHGYGECSDIHLESAV